MAIELSKHRKDIRALAAELDITPDLIYGWRREALGPRWVFLLPGPDRSRTRSWRKWLSG